MMNSVHFRPVLLPVARLGCSEVDKCVKTADVFPSHSIHIGAMHMLLRNRRRSKARFKGLSSGLIADGGDGRGNKVGRNPAARQWPSIPER